MSLSTCLLSLHATRLKIHEAKKWQWLAMLSRCKATVDALSLCVDNLHDHNITMSMSPLSSLHAQSLFACDDMVLLPYV